MGDLTPKWKRFRLNEMVASAPATRKFRGWNAKDAGVDRYIALEHLDSNCLKIRRWGSPDTVGQNSDIRHFERGDVILARRGIELRKVGLAAFSGVASGHALVFRANPKVILPDFLPFFIQSEVFMSRADRQSIGSLSNTVNLSYLMKEEFALPPVEEQRRITGVLQANERVFNALTNAVESAECLRIRMSVDLRTNVQTRPMASIMSALILSKPGMWGKDPGQESEGVDVTVLRSTDLNKHGELDMQGGAKRSIPQRNLDQLELHTDDLLLEKSGGGPDQPVGRIGFVEHIPAENRPFICGNFIQLLRADTSKADPEWLFWVMHGMHAAKYTLRHQAHSVGIRNLQTKDYLSDLINFPSIGQQKEQAEKVRAAEKTRKDLLARISASLTLKRKLLSDTLSRQATD